MPSVDHDGVSIHYEIHGEGPAVLFIHGAGGNSAVWWQQVPVFVACGHRVIVYDVRGFGRSVCDPSVFAPEHFVGDIDVVLDAESIDDVSVVAQALGGWTGVSFALARPERVKALVLAGSPGGLWTDRVQAAFDTFNAKVQAGDVSPLPSVNFLGDRFRAADPARTHLYDAIAGLNPPFEFGRTASVVQQRFSFDALDATGIPLLLIGGTDDPLWPPDAIRSVAERFDHASCQIFTGAGHSVYFEEPDGFNQAVLAFLRG